MEAGLGEILFRLAGLQKEVSDLRREVAGLHVRAAEPLVPRWVSPAQDARSVLDKAGATGV